MAVNATGNVTRLYVTRTESDRGVTLIRLDIPAAEHPKDAYLQLNKSHPN